MSGLPCHWHSRSDDVRLLLGKTGSAGARGRYQIMSSASVSADEGDLTRRLSLAFANVSRAEVVLVKTLRNLNAGAVRAAKVAISADVSDAFERLRAAQEELIRAREILEKV